MFLFRTDARGATQRGRSRLVSDLGSSLGLLRVTSLPGVHPRPPFDPILNPTVFYSCLATDARGATQRGRSGAFGP